jgi:hypothetical protein
MRFDIERTRATPGSFGRIYTKTAIKRNERIPNLVCIQHLRNASPSRECETPGIADAYPILFGRTKRALPGVHLTRVL